MDCLRRYAFFAALVALGAVSAAHAQVSSIDSAVVIPRVFNDIPGAKFSAITNYPVEISFAETNVTQTNLFANRDVWQFALPGATNGYQFQNDDFFHAAFDLTLNGNPISPRKEAGFLFSTASSGDLQFIVNTDGHEVVQFGGIGFFSFSVTDSIKYNSGDKIRLGMDYFRQENGKHALMFSANGVESPIQEFTSGGIGSGPLGGYFQIQKDLTNTSNSGTALFENITISRPVPAFSSIADEGLGVHFGWRGTDGPFLLQSKTSLSDPNWVDILTTSGHDLELPKRDDLGFWRLVDGTNRTILPFTVLMNGASEVPTVTNSAGHALGLISIDGTNLSYKVVFSGLSAPATAAHIHGYVAPTNAAGVIIPLNGASGTSGVLSGTTNITADELAGIVNGMTYMNIHTTNHPGGEIRGQLVPMHFPITLNAASEVPAVTNSTGTASGSLHLIGSELFYRISYSGLASPGIAAHIHGPATPTNSVGVIVPLNSPTGTNGTISGSVSLNPTNLSYLLSGLTYINIHTTTNPGGEIRGQVYPFQLRARMNGASEVPPTASSGSGRGTMTLVNSLLSYDINFTNLLSPAIAAHIHGPADTTQNASVLIPFNAPPAASGTISGSTNLDSQQLLYIVTGQTYANIHTTNYPGGEIRGQIRPDN